MFALQLIVAIGVAVVVGSLAARRWGVSAPVALVVAGLALTALPTLRSVGLPPEVVLLLFLPALLFWESLNTSSREIRRHLRGIILSGTLFVAVTAAMVAAVAHALGLDWTTSWLIGAAVAPTDATAVSSIGRMLPRSSVTVLRAESLINDGTALVIYALVLEAVSGAGSITFAHVSWLLVRSFVGGVVVGFGVGWAAIAVRRRLSDPMLSSVALLLTPFVGYLIAEEIHASGVLAVVTCGLFLTQVAPRLISAQSRQLSGPFWTVSTFVLNGALFVLIGSLDTGTTARAGTTTSIDLNRHRRTPARVRRLLAAGCIDFSPAFDARSNGCSARLNGPHDAARSPTQRHAQSLPLRAHAARTITTCEIAEGSGGLAVDSM